MPNFSSLASVEVAEKFVGGWAGSEWLLCLNSTLITLSCVEFGLGFDNTFIYLFSRNFQTEIHNRI